LSDAPFVLRYTALLETGVFATPQVLAWAAGSAASVEVKGSYDGWGPARRLQQQPNGSWAIAAYLAPGVYQVRTMSGRLF